MWTFSDNFLFVVRIRGRHWADFRCLFRTKSGLFGKMVILVVLNSRMIPNNYLHALYRQSVDPFQQFVSLNWHQGDVTVVITRVHFDQKVDFLP